MSKVRIDLLVFQNGLTDSRERARTEIMSGHVFVNGQRVDKPGTSVDENAQLELRGAAVDFVSRGGLKLQKALSFFAVDPTEKTCLDCGASTGGFTDCLLKSGAKKVYAVDVGYGQLAWAIRIDPRVVTLERTNIRYVTKEQIPDEIELAVIDVSFISLKLVLPAVKSLLKPDGEIVCLIKPQFEAGKGKVGKKGVVRDRTVRLEVLQSFLDYTAENGFAVKGLTFSPIKGPEGNVEFLGHLGSGENAFVDIEALVDAAQIELESDKGGNS
jgi:23S rRNA (cytidine1920-2'-O)/16S rRNA (cytidine1409-2'-O)-methyltransferase